ncbi:MAG: tubulin-like doman-containing protein [Aphanothece sp. CMT-3BRIN-NPC111]|jgi:hypothetical protein|nr:tubulin-like doman-containing protein [Aphanothece sp. CMT-3BRIN-NPC111]
MYSKSFANDRQFQGINRTICIGLGGTGRDVLMGIRRLIVDRYGHVNNLPLVSFVYIDTDKEATQAVSLGAGNIYQSVDIGFQEAENVNATMTPTEVSNLIQGLEKFRYNLNQPNAYQHIAQWFPPQLLRNIKSIEQGAKGIRPVGRLAFFHNYLKIKAAIEIAEQRTKGHEQALLQKWGLIVDPGLNIVVVGSLCGGTGSGTFLDMAYSLRYTYPTVPISGYLVISPELYENTPKMCANTYAGLMELDYYSSAETQFDACYDQRYLTIVQEKRPPFDYTYLVSKDTEQEKYSIDNKRKLFNVIAHKLALEFSKELAPTVKVIRDNFAQQMLQEDDRFNPTRHGYLTFGLAAIYFPRDRISQITLTQISAKLIAFWLQGEGQSPDPLKVLDRFLSEYRWHADLARKDGFISRLEATALESDKKFSVVMNSWKMRLENAIADCKTKHDRSSLMPQLQRNLREQFYKVQFGDTESTRGIWLAKLETSKQRLSEHLPENINSFLSALLTPSNQYFSIANARSWLDVLQMELNDYQYKLEERLKTLNGARKLEELDKKWGEIDRNIQYIESEFTWPIINNKNSRVQYEAMKALRETEVAIKHNFDYAAASEALEIVNVLQQHVQTCISQLTNLSHLVDEIKVYYEKSQNLLRQPNFDEMSGEEIFDREDVDSCYNLLLPEDELRAQMVKITQEILEPGGQGQSLEIILEGDSTNSTQLQQEIDLTVKRLFSDQSSTIVQSAIARFNQRYSASDRPVRLGQILREAAPLLPLNTSDRYFHNHNLQKSKLVGFKDGSDPEVQQFKTLLTQNLGIPENAIKPTQTEDEILIVTEYAGFPLRLINGLDQLKNHYLREKNNFANNLLHNERRNLFPDIIPPDMEIIEELDDIFYPCLAFDLIQQNQETQQLEFQYFDELRGNYYTAYLSPAWNQAVEQLVNSSNMTAALRERLDEAIADIERQPTRWQGHYLPKLRQFVEQVDNLPDDDINYPYRSRVVGATGTVDPFAKEGVINRFLKRIQGRVKGLGIQSPPRRAIAQSQKIITGEVVVDFPVDSGDNRIKRRVELEQLKQDLDEEIITPEEYEDLRQEILNKYPLRS